MFPIPAFLPINFALNSLFLFMLALLIVPGVVSFVGMSIEQLIPTELLDTLFGTTTPTSMGS